MDLIMTHKDPAFLFYSKDWLEGTAEMMPEEKGVYMDLLSHQHQKGSLPNDPKRLARMVGLSLEEFNKIWETISEKFIENHGRLCNDRLKKETDSRAEKACKKRVSGTFAAVIRESSVSDSVKSKIKKEFSVSDFLDVKTEELNQIITKWYNQMVASLDNHSENENENVNRILKESDFSTTEQLEGIRVHDETAWSKLWRIEEWKGKSQKLHSITESQLKNHFDKFKLLKQSSSSPVERIHTRNILSHFNNWIPKQETSKPQTFSTNR